jgi:hypothetical protein
MMSTMRLAWVVVIAACVSQPEDVPIVDDGFGEPCTFPADAKIIHECHTVTGEHGWCALNICRRPCYSDATWPELCPAGQIDVPTVANACWCEPIGESWATVDAGHEH